MFQASLETVSGVASMNPLMLPPEEKCSPDRAQHDDAHACVLVERLEHQPQLVALRHRDDVERRPVEDDVGALARRVDLDAEAVERREARIGELITLMLRFLCVRLPRLVFARDQLAAQQLADRRFRDRLDEHIAARPLEFGKAGRAAILVELVGVDRRAALDESRDDLAPALVRQARPPRPRTPPDAATGSFRSRPARRSRRR